MTRCSRCGSGSIVPDWDITFTRLIPTCLLCGEPQDRDDTVPRAITPWGEDRPKYGLRICPQCDGEYMAAMSHQKYCSSVCGEEARKERKRTRRKGVIAR